MIQNSKRVASYVYLRNGTYYFQLRLKRHDTRQAQFKSGLIRKSLQTGDYREAVNKARLLWTRYMHMSKDFKNSDDVDEQMQYHNDLYSRGKHLHAQFSKIDRDDINAQEDFFLLYIGGSKGFSQEFDKEAFKFYAEYLNRKADKAEQVVVSTQSSNASEHAGSDLSIREAIQKFKDDNANGLKSWGVDQSGNYDTDLDFFQQQMGHCNLIELTYEKIRDDYINKLHKLPCKMKQNKLFYKDGKQIASIDEIIKVTEAKELTTLSVQTCKKKANRVKSFLRFCTESRHLNKDILDVFVTFDKVKVRGKKRINFSKEHLKLIFERDEFSNGIWFRKYVWRHWGLLLALYTGARINEICQLDVTDIIEDQKTGISYIKFQSGDGKRLKNENAHREVPVHKTLIELGFLNYVASQKHKKEKQGKLFSELSVDCKGTWCRKLKDWFNVEYLKKVGIEKQVSEKYTTLSFHGIRSTFINQGKQLCLDNQIMQEIVGHAAVGSAMTNTYADVYNLENKKRVINKIKYEIDISKIKKWTRTK